VLDGVPGAASDIVALNAGAALYAANLASDLGDGLERARQVIASGAARRKLDELVSASARLAQA
jgi:anthranilate phosphoribosyltransferase